MDWFVKSFITIGVIFWQVTEAEGSRDSGKSPEDPPQVLLHADLPREAGYRTQRVHRTGQ